MVEFATSYPDATALPNIGSQSVARALVELFSRYDVPREIVSDRGLNFTLDGMKEVWRPLLVKQLLTTPKLPICNELVERLNRRIKLMLKKNVPGDTGRQALSFTSATVHQPRGSHSSVGFSPFEMFCA